MSFDERLIDELVGELRPARPMTRAGGLATLGSAVTTTALAVLALFGLRPGPLLVPDSAWFLLGELILFGLGLACGLATLRMARPDMLGRPSAFWAVVMASSMPAAALAVLVAAAASGEPLLGRLPEMHCALFGIVFAVLTGAALTTWLRRGAPAVPARAGLYAGICAGAVGSAVYGLSCPQQAFMHWAIWHFVPVVACGMFGRVVLARLLRW